MAVPEWKLEEGTEAAETYRFENINPKLVFLLALAAGGLAVAIIYFCYVAVSSAIDAQIIPEPPRLQGLVE